MPAAETQTSTQKSSSSPPIIDASKTGDDISPQPTNYSSQQTGGGTGFASPVLPTPAVSIADSLTTFSLDDPTIALTETHPADPFTEAGDVVWYVRPPSSGQYGPATGKLMRQWLAEGRIGPDTLVWREGWRDWQQASAVFPQLRTNAPLTDINKNVVPLVQPISLPEAQPADTRTPKNMLSLIVTLIVLTVVIIVGLFIWAYTRGPNPAKVNSRTPSTRLELRDTLNPHRLS